MDWLWATGSMRRKHSVPKHHSTVYLAGHHSAVALQDSIHREYGNELNLCSTSLHGPGRPLRRTIGVRVWFRNIAQWPCRLSDFLTPLLMLIGTSSHPSGAFLFSQPDEKYCVARHSGSFGSCQTKGHNKNHMVSQCWLCHLENPI